MLALGMSCYEMGRWLGEHSTSVQRWVRSFEQRGFAGLEEGNRPGRPSRIASGILRKLEREPRSPGYEQTLWDASFCRIIWSTTSAASSISSTCA
jgi:transposase